MRLAATTLWLLPLLFLALPPRAVRAAPADLQRAKGNRLFGLVIGTNVSRDPQVKPLRYADDDAIQNASLLSELGAQVILLVEPDAQSRRLHPGLQSTAPTKAALSAALERLNGLMDQARAGGLSPILYLFYSGHGDVENNEGYVNLKDARLRRQDLLELLRRSRADKNHLVVDACKSYFLVFSRGSGGQRTALTGALVERGEALPKNTGVFLSTSAAVDSHEWEAFGGGIFSHELRSALRGAADLDGDGKLTYEEVSAFIWSANASIPNPRFRPGFFSRPPRGEVLSAATLLHYGHAPTDRVVIGPGIKEHLYVEDARGLRLADLRLGYEQRIELRVPSRRPLFVRFVDSRREVALPSGSRLQLASLSPRRVTSARRGAEHLAFRSLFRRAFDAGAIKGFRERPVEILGEQRPATDTTWIRRGLGIGALGVGIAGGVLTALAARERGAVDQTTDGIQRLEVNDRIDGLNTGAVICYAVAGAGIAAYLLWTFWPEPEVKVKVMPTHTPSLSLSVDF